MCLEDAGQVGHILVIKLAVAHVAHSISKYFSDQLWRISTVQLLLAPHRELLYQWCLYFNTRQMRILVSVLHTQGSRGSEYEQHTTAI